MRFCDLTEKEVINVCDCKCLGNVHDLDIDECDGRIRALIIPGTRKMVRLFLHGSSNCLFRGVRSSGSDRTLF